MSKRNDYASEVYRKLELAPAGHRTAFYVHNLTDLGNAERLIDRHGLGLRYVHPWGKWLAWDGRRWAVDATGEVYRRACDTATSIYAEAATVEDKDKRKALGRHAERSESRNRIDAMIALARSRPGVPAMPEEFDADPWLLNVANGTVDLRTGTLRPHDPEDLITKLAPVEYQPGAEAPRFARFLEEILDGDEEMEAFVRRFAGYTLTGSVEERVFAILHGSGKNGKSTLVELFQGVLGDYATTADTETILAKRHQGVGNDVAALKGARFVAAAEVEQDRRLAESKVKSLTGNDTISARFLYSEPFTFKPEFKLWLSTNNKPAIRGTDDAIWDRIRLIPFERRFVGKSGDPKLPEKLRKELPGVLAWMVRGCLEWQRHGLGEPDKVTAATASYRSESDVLGSFIEERCVVREGVWVRFSDLYAAYDAWCTEAHETPEKKRRFGTLLKERGLVPDRGAGHVPIRRGIALREDRGPDPGARGTASSERAESYRSPTASDSVQGGKAGRRVTSTEDSYPTVTRAFSHTYAENSEEGYPSYPKVNDSDHDPLHEGGYGKNGNEGNLGNFASPALGDTLRKGTEDKSGHVGATEPANLSLADGGSMSSVAEGGNDVVGPGVPHEAERRIRRLVREGWSEYAARAEVLAKDHPLDCECEVCV